MEKKKSLFHTNVDLLNGPIFKALVIFAVPLFISNVHIFDRISVF